MVLCDKLLFVLLRLWQPMVCLFLLTAVEAPKRAVQQGSPGEAVSP